MKSIGVIGNGFVGGAIAAGLKHYNEVKIYDKEESKSTDTLENVLKSDITFIAVPTPMSLKNGCRCDLSAVEDIFKKSSDFKTSTIFVIKSTVPIGTTSELQEKYPDFNILHSPEFLTARTAELDFITPSRNIVGFPEKFTESHNVPKALKELYEERFPGTNCQLMASDESEAVKYIANCFFAVKISYFNQVKMLCDKLNLNWDRVMRGVLSDGRIGISHYQVPGHDGKPGFGGTCFPKDINSLINIMKTNGVDPLILQAAWDLNVIVRPEKDWEKYNAAVSEAEDIFDIKNGLDASGCGHDHL